MLRLAPPLTILLFIGPVVAGLIGTILPAAGWLPAVGAVEPSLRPLRLLLAEPGLWRSVAVASLSGIGATILAFVGAMTLCATLHGTPLNRAARRLLPPLLAVPHLSVAIGLAFLLAPSGWLARLASPWLSGWTRPPDLLTVNDPWGLTLMLGLAVREMPFLVFTVFAALREREIDHSLEAARALGYGRAEAWMKLVLPRLYPRLRLPLYAVLAFSLSVVDMAIVLGPAAPATLSVRLLRWFQDPDLSLRLVAASGALLQLAVVVTALMAWHLVERLIAATGRSVLVSGPQPPIDAALRLAGLLGGALALGLGALALLLLVAWSLAGAWRFPSVLPSSLDLSAWQWVAPGLGPALLQTILIGIAVTAVSVVLVLACLEHESRTGPRPEARVMRLVYLPLLVPQTAFVFGLQVMFASLRLDGTLAGLVWAHLAFVLPYVFLMLRGPYLGLGERLPVAGRVLGHAPWSVFFRIKLPLLRRAIAFAAAIGFSVSCALYLPTVVIGAGRIPTLATEAVALASGGDRRLAAVTGLILALLPLAALIGAGLSSCSSPRSRRYARPGHGGCTR